MRLTFCESRRLRMQSRQNVLSDDRTVRVTGQTGDRYTGNAAGAMHKPAQNGTHRILAT